MAGRPNKTMAKRALAAILAIIIVGFGADLFSLFRIQIIKGEEYRSKASAQQLSDTTIHAQRGTIFDRNMNVLAESASAWKVYLVPSKIESQEQSDFIVKGLAEILGMDAEKVQKKAVQTGYNYVVVKEKIENDVRLKVLEFIDQNRKKYNVHIVVGVEPDNKRYYPYNNFASSVIGFTGADDDGRSGLELKYNDILTGVPGRIVTAKDGNQNKMDSQYESTYDAQKGTSLVLTIDNVIQFYLEKSLKQAYIDTKAKHAYGIVMDVETGAILAMTNQPDFNLNDPYTLANAELSAQIDAIADSKERNEKFVNAQFDQWRNRAISDTYEPGSVFKVVTASAGLEENVVTPNSQFFCGGSIHMPWNRTYNCANRNGHGSETFTQGLMNSCNPVFITVGQNLGTEKFYEYFEAFGLTEKTGIDLPAEVKPTVGGTYYAKDKFTVSDLASSSFGQSFQVSPIQMLTAVAAVANNGKLMQPYIVGAMLDEQENTVSTTQPVVKRQVVSEKVAKEVCSMMEMVVQSGTGKNGYVPGYHVAGKTGTSQKLTSADSTARIASFTCFAPVDDPKIAVLIVIDEPQGLTGGGAVAAPVAAEVIENVMPYLNIEPRYTDEELAKLEATSPSLTGLTVAQAKTDAQNQGFTVKVVGGGETVTSQVPEAGQPMPKNGVIVLYTDGTQTGTAITVPDLTGLSIAQANQKANEAGLNIKISGSSASNAASDATLKSYKQSLDAGSTADMGATVTVYFKSDTGLDEFVRN